MKNWIKKFDKEYDSFFQEVEAYGVKKDIITFTNTLLEKQRKDIVKEIEAYKKFRINEEAIATINIVIDIIKNLHYNKK